MRRLSELAILPKLPTNAAVVETTDNTVIAKFTKISEVPENAEIAIFSKKAEIA